MSDTAAVCSHCERATQGRIYDGYKCAECHIEFLESHEKTSFEEWESAIEKSTLRITELNKELSEYRKYKWAYEMLVKELTKK